ncbi:MAG: methyltransferase domain-containing protein [Candidatus Sumerlaeaceae bacterium]|nr:methyltransferase domain-containing protein [Candidatus Sumerlaeaceae bacterium]
MFLHENELWWYRGLREVLVRTVRQLSQNMSANAPVIVDAGCGTGGNLVSMCQFGCALGIDLAWEALERAKRRELHMLARGRVQSLPLRSESADIILSLDVLYHRWIENDLAVLREYCRALKPLGWLIVHVAAHEWLRGAHDDVVMTRHRYSRRELVEKIEAAGLRVWRATYRNSLLVPLMFLHRFRSLKGGRPRSDVELPPRWVNGTLLAVLRLENLLLRFVDFPVGGSLLVIARKPIA